MIELQADLLSVEVEGTSNGKMSKMMLNVKTILATPLWPVSPSNTSLYPERD